MRARVASFLLGGLPGRDRREVLADLEDLWRERRTRTGPLRAGLYYWWQVLGHALRLEARGILGGGPMGSWRQELRQAARRLVRAPVFAAVSVLTIAVGIGAFTSVFSVVDAVLIEEPGYDEPDELVWVWRKYWFGLDRGWLGGPDITGLRTHTDVFEGVVGIRMGQANLTSRDGTAPRRVDQMRTTAEFFDLLGVPPAMGRGFRAEDDVPGAPGVAVLGHELFVSQFGSDPSVLGREIYLNGEAVQVVGVAPEDFHFVQHSSLGDPSPADLYVPLRIDLAAADPGSGAFAGLARVRADVTPARLQAAVSAVAQVTDDLWGNPGLEMWSVGLEEDLVAGVRPALLALLGSAGFLLMILGANLATLLLGRANVRERELAVRSALGAGRTRMLQSVVSESLLLAALGVTLGLGSSVAGVRLIRALAPDGLPRLWAVELDLSVAAAALTVTMAMALATGLVPALHGLRAGTPSRIREAGQRAGVSRRAARLRSALVVSQVALSLMLLVGAGLLANAFSELLHADPGFDGQRVVTFAVPLDPSRYPDGEQVVEFDTRFREAVRAITGVTDVGAANALPLSAQASQRDVTFPAAPGNTGDEDDDSPLIDEFRIGVGYAEALGVRVLAGRSFTEADGADAPPVALIDDQLARRFFPDSDPVGAVATLGGDTVSIVGVVDHARQYRVHRDDRPQVYRPLAQQPTRGLAYAIRTAGDSRLVLGAAREALRAVDASVPMGEPRTLDAILADSLGRERLSLTLMMSFALGALVLASLGIYGIVANGVVRRTHEIGVRMALGADRTRLLVMVVSQGLRLAVVGVAIGLVGASATADVLGSVVEGAGRFQPAVWSSVSAALLATAALASWIPALRATRIQPQQALRPE